MAALFCALAFASTCVLRINVMFLTFDSKDAIITIAGLLFGPVYSLSISLVVSIIEFISIGDTGFWGFLMDFLSTAIFSTTCALIYKYKKNIKGAVIGLVASVFTMTGPVVSPETGLPSISRISPSKRAKCKPNPSFFSSASILSIFVRHNR